jgi:hypothetical protein
MLEKDKERLMFLCAQAAVEQDGEKLMALVSEINALLDAKQKRLDARKTPPEAPAK